MIIPVICTFCKREGTFDIKLTFIHHRRKCTTCGDMENREWTFDFCGPGCLKEWMYRHLMPDFGFPCQDCLCPETGVSTGWAAGIKENGMCPTCRGERKVKECTPAPHTSWRMP